MTTWQWRQWNAKKKGNIASSHDDEKDGKHMKASEYYIFHNHGVEWIRFLVWWKHHDERNNNNNDNDNFNNNDDDDTMTIDDDDDNL